MTQERKLFRWIQKFAELALSRPGIAMAVSLFVIFVSIAGLKVLKTQLDIYDSADPDFASLTKMAELREEFGDSSSLYLLLAWPESPRGPQLCELMRKLDSIERTQPQTKTVFHLFKARKIVSETDRYWYPTLLGDPCLQTELSLSDHLKNWDPQGPYQVMNQGPRHLLIQIQFNQQFLPASAGSWLDQLKSTEYQYSAVGPAAFRYHLYEIIKKDSILHLLVLLFFIIFCRIFLGTWCSGFFYILTLALTSLALAGFMGLFGLPIDVLTNNLFLLTAIAGTADFMFVGWGLKQGRSLADALKTYSVPCFFTTLTTMVGFLSLLTSDLTIIRNFGVAAALGAFLEWFFCFFTLPSLLVLMKQQNRLVVCGRNWLQASVEKFSARQLPRVFTVAILLLVIASPFAFFQLHFEENPLKNFPATHELSEHHRTFSEKTNWLGALYLVFPRSTPPTEIKQCLSKAANFAEVQKIENPFFIRDYFLTSLSPLRAESVEFDLIKHGPLKSFFGPQSVRALLFLKETSPESLEHLNRQVGQNCVIGTSIVGQSEVYREVSVRLSETLTDSFVVSLLIVLIIIFCLQLMLGNRNYLSLPLSIVAGPLCMISVMAFAQVRISPMNSLFLAVLVGITGDNAIQYLFAGRNRNLQEGLQQNGGASVVIGLAMILSSLFFLLQTLIPMKTLGILFSTGFALNLIGDLWFLKGLLKIETYLTNRSIAPKTDAEPKE